MPTKNQTKPNTRRSKPTNQKNAQRPKLVFAPQSRGVRATVPSDGEKHQIPILEIRKPANKNEWVQEYIIHPDNIPWLEGIAPSYQRWGLKGLRVWYEPRATATTPGTVSMGILSDFKDGTPNSLQSLSSVKGTVRGAPWDRFVLSCPKYRTYEYVSDPSSLNGEELNNRALGKIVVYADMDSTFPAEAIVGRIFIEYTEVFTGAIDSRLQRKLITAPPATTNPQ
uniref:Capsid protein n=1 Tax=Taian Tombu tick virus 1 TaxID=2972342 RepID=A0A9E7V1Y8_9TOMB|nr:MAG: coat protein [Taian Tombu tick virus 1]